MTHCTKLFVTTVKCNNMWRIIKIYCYSSHMVYLYCMKYYTDMLVTQVKLFSLWHIIQICFLLKSNGTVCDILYWYVVIQVKWYSMWHIIQIYLLLKSNVTVCDKLYRYVCYLSQMVQYVTLYICFTQLKRYSI